jgi:hypothetical protein
MSRLTQAAAAAALLVFSTGTAMATCPNWVVIKNIKGAPVWSHTGTAATVFKIDGDPNLYGMPLDAILDASGNLVRGHLDGNCLPPLRGRLVMAAQINSLVTTNNLIDELNRALNVGMPFLTIAFDVSADIVASDDGDAILVSDNDQPSEPSE